MRITSPSGKAGIVVGAIIIVPLVGVVLGIVNVFAGYAWSLLTMIGLVAFTARVFRGPQESQAPRPPWRMTTTGGASAMLSVLFLVQAIVAAVGSMNSPLGAAGTVGAVLLLAIAVAYAVSAVRLLASRRTQALQ